jgi:S-formylglutathione hydrolase FrmB
MTRLILCAFLVACGKDTPPPKPPANPETPPPVTVAPREKTKSQVVTETFHSDALGVDKDVMVYLPAGYDPGDARRYPVFYYLSGLGGDETNWIQMGGLDKVADTLELEAIVVMPDGDNNFYFDSAMDTKYEACLKDGEGMFIRTQSRKKTCVKASKYETYMTKDLIGWVDGKYKTIPTREARAIAGISMGGFGALMLSMRHPDLYSAAVSHSGLITPLYMGPYPYEKGKVQLHPSIASLTNTFKLLGNLGPWVLGVFGNDIANWRAHDPAVLAQKLTPGKLHLYLDCGTEDEFLFHHSVQYLHDLLLEKGIKHEYFLGPGHHSFDFWRDRLPISLAFLRDRLAKPN